MNSDDQQWTDRQLEKLFSLLNHDVPPPDATLLEDLRARSTAEFEAQFQDSAVSPQRRSKMMVFATRIAMAAAAAAIVIVSWIFTHSGEDERPTLQIAVLNLSRADSYHLQLVSDTSTTNIWGRKPNQVRWELPDGSYRIDDGEKLWEIDEAANRVVARKSAVADKELGIDLSRFFAPLTPQDYRELLKERPVDQVESDGKRCDVYRWSRDARDGTLQVEALVSAETATLRSLETVVKRGADTQLVGKLVVEATNFDVDERLFRIADTLTVDGRIGKVLDAQGLVAVKPLNHSRWTPIGAGTILKPSDLVRCNLRGANAATLRLVKQKRVTLGPGTVVELLSPARLRLISGEIKVVTDRGSPLEVVGPDQQQLVVAGTQAIRLADRQLVKLEKEPAWVAGFEGATTTEAVGSLVAKIDGRDIPLTVGYHKVTVDIRDQIARTVIEESFVNHTKAQLEGVFYFPLPQDASISGFGMWIGNELVEADIVEKQRAREIYETILRERRDPGLLEWTGGNLFKARVFPIPARSEKRIKISYTQVLPLKGEQYRYTYSLQSELLKQHPLSELAITVNINSHLPLTEVSSPTHPARISSTQHSARVEFTAQEYTPDRDFEVTVGVQQETSDVVFIPHQRGDDGYFMLQLMPPAPANDDVADGQFVREVLSDSEPLELLVIADTSASIREDARKTQAEFIAALLSSLAPSDTFNLVMSDVECHWLFDEPVPADVGNVDAALQALDARVSLGWTDLDKTFEAVLKHVNERTHVVYLGDGVVTTGDADPIAFNKRLERAYQGHTVTMHAVALSSSFEPLVMKTIASLGGGSFRSIASDQGVLKTARELLSEITQPVTRITDVRFSGLQTARLYPEELPNLPRGTQQILLGRYLPAPGDVRGEVTVTVMRGDESIETTSPFEIKQHDEGNSFIPRLWARMHLDVLLDQGASETIKDDVIALSEEYHIITPYTSLLVLESDADRERFQVKRRFQMRDGERFFAQGREQIDYELLQQQMRKAGGWRIQLRMNVLRELASLGRQESNPQRYQFSAAWALGPGASMDSLDWSGDMYDVNGRGLKKRELAGIGGSWGGGGAYEVTTAGEDVDFKFLSDRQNRWDIDDEYGGLVDDLKKKMEVAEDYELPILNRLTLSDADMLDISTLRSSSRRLQPSDLFAANEPVAFAGAGERLALFESAPAAFPVSGGYGGAAYGYFGRYASGKPQPAPWRSQLFPNVPVAPAVAPESRFKSTWPDNAIALAQSLLRKELLAAPAQPLEIDRQVTYYEPRWQEPTSRQHATYLLSADSWLSSSGGNGGQTLIQLCNSDERSIHSEAFLLGRRRSATEQDLAQPPIDLSGYVLRSLEETYRDYDVQLESVGEGRIRLTLTHATRDGNQVRVLIDTEKSVIVEWENRQQKTVTSKQEFSRFVQVAGAWFATQIETRDDQGRRTVSVSQRFTQLDDAHWERRLGELQANRGKVQWVRDPVPNVLEARRRVAEDQGRFEDHLVLLVKYESIQRWNRVLEQLEAMEELAAGKPGMEWIRNAILDISRHRDVLRKRILDQAAVLAQPAESTRPEELFLANHLIRQAAGFFESNEMLSLLETLKPVFQRQPSPPPAMKQWHQYEVSRLQNAGRNDEALAVRKQLAIDYPHDSELQRQYAGALMGVKEYEAGRAWIDHVLTPNAQWNAQEEESLRQVVTGHLRQSGRYHELAEYLGNWYATNPKGQACYREYLTALIKSDQIEKSNELIGLWLDARQWPADPPQHLASRAQAAVQQAVGNGYDLSTNRMDEKWLDPLARIVMEYLKQDSDAELLASVADNIMSQSPFTSSAQCSRVRRAALQELHADLAVMSRQRANRLINWILPNNPTVEREQWLRFVNVLTTRWEKEPNPLRRNEWGSLIVHILSRRVGTEKHLAFLRRQIKEGPQRFRASYVSMLFETLLQQPWSQQVENEAASLIPDLSDSEDSQARLAAQVAALYRLTDTMTRRRYDKLMSQVNNQSELTRTELREAQAGRLEQARREYAQRLDVWRRTAPESLAPWFDAEWTYLQMRLGGQLDEVAARCWEFLTDEPKLLDPEPGDAMQFSLLHRYLLTLGNLAARRDPPAGLSERLMQYVDKAIERSADPAFWKRFKYRMLIALDQTAGLVELLESWIGEEDQYAQQWRVAQANLLAEQGRIRDAIGRLEPLRDQDLLDATQLAALEDWLLVVDRKDEYTATRRRRIEMTDESTLQNWLSIQLQFLQGNPVRGRWANPFGSPDEAVPGEMDQNVPLVLSVLFAKSTSPRNYLSYLRQFYQNTHDFQLLSGMADSVVGHTAGRVYPFLIGVSSVLREVREEATCDSLVEHLELVRQQAKTEVDQRALDLLELLVERRCAELLNQPGPHAERALAAMQRAFRREWSSGEPKLMTDLLASLGHISVESLAEKQLSEVEALQLEAEPGTGDWLHIAGRLAQIYWSYSRHDAAIDRLESALDARQAASDGVLPTNANDELNQYIGYLEYSGWFTRGEKVLKDQLQHPANAQQTLWLKERLYRLYDETLQHDGEVSLGKGVELYREVTRRLQVDFDHPDNNYRRQLIQRLMHIYTTAHEREIGTAPEDLVAFARDRLPEVLLRQTNDYHSLAGEVANTIERLAGGREALAMLIRTINDEPRWFAFTYNDGWNQHCWRLGQLRERLKSLGDLEQPLLKIVTRELRNELESRSSRNRVMYWQHYGYFWTEQVPAFVRTAETVYAQRKDSTESVEYIARYLADGLDKYPRAIEMLATAHERGILSESGKSTLVGYLHHEKRFEESIPLLEPLVEQRPDNMHYRTRLMHAYFRTARQRELLALLKQTDEYFHEGNRWVENNIAQLAYSCLENELYEQSVEYYNELIPLHKRTAPNRGIGGGTLSAYCQSLARAYTGCGKTSEAVDAACEAIVSWGPRLEQRTGALHNLEQVLRDAPELDQYVAQLDRESAEEGLDKPIVRKALGTVYFAERQYAKAAEQLRQAVALQPNDSESHQKLIECFDKLENQKEAIAQSLALLQLKPREIEMYKSVAQRFEQLGDAEDVERTYTSIVEALPNEAEGHSMLASIREDQGRWKDAALHWQQVARIRSLEPTGLLKLAAVQIRLKQWQDAKETLAKLRSRSWPSRFGSVDSQVRAFERQIE